MEITTYRFNLKDLDAAAFLRRLQQKFGAAEVEIKVKPTEAAGKKMDETQFWKIIALLDWEKEGDDEAVLKPAVLSLADFPVGDIFTFEDLLAEKLYQLDTQPHAMNMGEDSFSEDSDHFSVDEFLYARCCVLANGKAFFENVLKDPAKMPKDLAFEALLRLASLAYRHKTETLFDYVPAWNYETFANAEGWNGKSFAERILRL